MRIEERLTLAVDGATAWAFVSDCEALLALLPGVVRVLPSGEDAWQLRVHQRVGFIAADFDVRVAMVRKEPPGLMRFRSEVQGVQVPAVVVTNDELRLQAAGAGTELTFVSDVQISGALAALGHGVMKVKVRQLIDEFRRRVVEKARALQPRDA